MTKKQREVRIELSGSMYFVRYADRKPRQRHLAAQFYAPDHTLARVTEWVKQQPHLKLIEEGK